MNNNNLTNRNKHEKHKKLIDRHVDVVDIIGGLELGVDTFWKQIDRITVRWLGIILKG